MKKIYLALLVVAFAATGAMAQSTSDQVNSFAKGDKQIVLAQASTTAAPGSVVVTPAAPNAPASTTTVTVHGGDLLAKTLNWFYVAFGGVISAALLAVAMKVFAYFGIQIADSQRAQLQAVVVNGLNSAAAKAQDSLRTNAKLDIEVRDQVVQEAIAYTQAHASETIKALGLDPQSGDAVEAIRARIETAINDPATPTAPSITPDSVIKSAQPLAPNA